MNELTRLDLPAPVAPGDQHVRHLGEVHQTRPSVHILAKRDLERVGRILRGGRAQDVAEHHEVAVLVGHLDADRGLAGDRRLDPHVGRSQRVGDVAGQRQHLVDLRAGGDLDLVHRDRRAAVGARDVRIDPEVAKRLLERLVHLRLVGTVGRRGRRLAEQIQGRELVGTVGGLHGAGATHGHRGREFIGVIRVPSLVEVGLEVRLRHDDELVSLGLEKAEGLLQVPDALLLDLRPDGLVHDELRRRLVFLLDVGGGEEVVQVRPGGRDRGSREDQQPEQREPEAHDRRPDRGDHVCERVGDQRAHHTARSRDERVAGRRRRVAAEQRQEPEDAGAQHREPDEHTDALLAGRVAQQQDAPVDADYREEHRGHAPRATEQPSEEVPDRARTVEPQPQHRDERDDDQEDPEGIARVRRQDLMDGRPRRLLLGGGPLASRRLPRRGLRTGGRCARRRAPRGGSLRGHRRVSLTPGTPGASSLVGRCLRPP